MAFDGAGRELDSSEGERITSLAFDKRVDLYLYDYSKHRPTGNIDPNYIVRECADMLPAILSCFDSVDHDWSRLALMKLPAKMVFSGCPRQPIMKYKRAFFSRLGRIEDLNRRSFASFRLHDAFARTEGRH